MFSPPQDTNCSRQSYGEETSPQGARPYRSHKVPACDRCRKRKLRCTVDISGQPCQLCRASSAACTQPQRGERSSNTREMTESRNLDIANPPNQNYTNQPAKRRHLALDDEPPEISSNDTQSFLPRLLNPIQNRNELPLTPQNSATPRGESGSKSSMIVGPVMAEDVQMIEKYMSSHGRVQQSPRDNLYNTISDNPKDPVLYLTVPRRRQGLSLKRRPGEKQREILEQILGPLIDDVVALYFEYIHPSFPVLDEEHFVYLYRAGNKSLSAALVCDLLASSLIYWHRSKALQNHPCPDLLYVWNLAVAALQEEFQAPGMSTINAVLLDLMGRPTTSITGNTINSGRTVGLSHILGLNRNPETWKISDAEKKMRIRLWWGVLIHDRWSSFAHGVPTYITKNQYQVPLPTIEILMTEGMDITSRREAAECFIALCTLTEILGDVLPLVYDRREKLATETSKVLRRLQLDLDNWEDSEPVLSLLRRANEDGREIVSGSSSLKLGFLSVKMLICRIAFRNATHTTEPGLSETKRYSQAMLRESAREIIIFLCSLKSHHLSEFWTPYSAYHISSATIILLRCAIETNDPLIISSCKSSLLDFMAWLQCAKVKDKWDLADICLAQCEDPIMQIYGNKELPSQARESVLSYEMNQPGNNVRVFEGVDATMFNFNGFNGGVHTGPSVMDAQNYVNGFEYPWADMWDLF